MASLRSAPWTNMSLPSPEEMKPYFFLSTNHLHTPRWRPPGGVGTGAGFAAALGFAASFFASAAAAAASFFFWRVRWLGMLVLNSCGLGALGSFPRRLVGAGLVFLAPGLLAAWAQAARLRARLKKGEMPVRAAVACKCLPRVTPRNGSLQPCFCHALGSEELSCCWSGCRRRPPPCRQDASTRPLGRAGDASRPRANCQALAGAAGVERPSRPVAGPGPRHRSIRRTSHRF